MLQSFGGLLLEILHETTVVDGVAGDIWELGDTMRALVKWNDQTTAEALSDDVAIGINACLMGSIDGKHYKVMDCDEWRRDFDDRVLKPLMALRSVTGGSSSDKNGAAF